MTIPSGGIVPKILPQLFPQKLATTTSNDDVESELGEDKPKKKTVAAKPKKAVVAVAAAPLKKVLTV